MADRCNFVAIKTGQRCQKPPTNKYGFCKKHENTLQASKKQLNMEKEKKVNSRSTRVIRISPNKYGRYEDPETHLVFDPLTKEVIGTQSRHGDELLSLTEKDIAICISRRLKYRIDAPEEPSEESVESVESTESEEFEEQPSDDGEEEPSEDGEEQSSEDGEEEPSSEGEEQNPHSEGEDPHSEEDDDEPSSEEDDEPSSEEEPSEEDDEEPASDEGSDSY